MGEESRKMDIGAAIIELCDKKIEIMEKSECPQWVKEKTIKEKKTCKKILEVICDINGITVNAAIQILNESKEIIKEK